VNGEEARRVIEEYGDLIVLIDRYLCARSARADGYYLGEIWIDGFRDDDMIVREVSHYDYDSTIHYVPLSVLDNIESSVAEEVKHRQMLDRIEQAKREEYDREKYEALKARFEK
jgi:hypothetical protein